MKIKKVEISGFRAFDLLEDATFDFSLKDGQTANFVSIYAPNGFGKTSFYDAVEWCITDQIERFHRNHTEFKKIHGESKKENNENSYFLQHHGTTVENKFVKVISENKEFIRNIPSSKVYDFANKGQNSFFKDIILSQELIDSFIKEEKAEERYVKFVRSFPDLNKYNNKLQNIVKLLILNSAEIKILTKLIKDKEKGQLKLDFKNDEKILEEINKSISILLKLGEDLKNIQKEEFTDNDFKLLSNKTQSRLTGLRIELEAIKLYQENIDLAYNGDKGNPNLKGIVNYFDLKKQTEILNEKLLQFKKLQDLFFRKNSTVKLLTENHLKKSEILAIKDLNVIFNIIENEILSLNKSIKDQSEVKKTWQGKVKPLSEKKENLETRLNKSKLELSEVEFKFQKIEPNSRRINEINELIKKLGNIPDLEFEIKQKSEEIQDLNLRIKELDYNLIQFSENIELILENKDLKFLDKLVTDFLENEQLIGSLNTDLIQIDQRIESHSSLRSEIIEFIKRGLEIIEKHDSEICPLCTHKYKSYTELSEKIVNNDSLGEVLKLVFSQKNEIEKNISKVQEGQIQKKNIISKQISELKSTIIKQRDKVLFSITQNAEQVSQLKKIITEKADLEMFFESKDPKNFKKELGLYQKTIQSQIIEDIKGQEKLTTELIDANQSFELLNKTINDCFKMVEEKRNIEEYVKVKKFFEESLNTSNINFELIDLKIEEMEQKISDLHKSDLSLKPEIDKLLSILKIQFDNDEIKDQLLLHEKGILLNQTIMKNFEQYLNSKYGIELSLLNLKETGKAFEKLKKNANTNKNQLELIIKNYAIIDSLKEQTRNFLVAENTKMEITKLNSQLDSMKVANVGLEAEKKELQAYLKRKIDKFFFSELINKLYQKIDPHPDCGEIKFDCDFGDARPRLQIFTKDKKGNWLTPALYFSSAQTNILSLCIFIARALKAVDQKGKPLKCIFIDDPIQSMDSINVLSFIDLFRSLIVNLDIQIIVSTHEENFHLLLQKKIPKDMFKSKFIQFETFGKLEKEMLL